MQLPQEANIQKMRDRLADNALLLAPMAGYTDSVFRGICKQFGCGLTYTEMVSAQGLAYNNANTLSYLELSEFEDDIVVQLFGKDPEVMAAQAKRIEGMLEGKLFAFDINMGCPVHKVVKKGEGSALMNEPALAAEIVAAMVEAVEVPVTVKFRRGFELDDDTCVEFGLAMQEAGAAAACVHGRFSREFYHGTADWDSIARVKQALSIPVMASGDLLDHKSIAECLRKTNADAAMVARGAIGNPWIFPQAASYLASGCTEEPAQAGLLERIRVARAHTERLAARDPHDVLKMRTFVSGYFKGMPGAAKYRQGAMMCKTPEQFASYYDEIEAHARQAGYIEGDEAL